MKNDPTRHETVLLFHAQRECDRFFPYDRTLRRAIGPAYERIGGTQTMTCFPISLACLVEALRRSNVNVVINDREQARRHPDAPVGIAGDRCVLDGWDLPNPALLGPGLVDHPSDRPELPYDPRFRGYIVPCRWVREVFAKAWGERVVPWHAGIDLAEWPDTRSEPKNLDVLVYDAIRWRREYYVPTLLEPMLSSLRRRSLRYEIVRSDRCPQPVFRALLRRSCAMLFVSEHETQGLAYQEALASNVPVLAWDNGYWLHPNRPRWEKDPVPATSVPYFSDECGERFRGLEDFEDAVDRFLVKQGSYEPRRYVARELSLEGSAQLYLQAYRSLRPGVSRLRNTVRSAAVNVVRPGARNEIVEPSPIAT